MRKRFGVWGLVVGFSLAGTAVAAVPAQEAIRSLRAREADPVGLFAHDDAKVREEAVDAYGGVDDAIPVKVRALLGLLRDPARGVRAAAIRQLGAIGVEKALAPTSGLLNDVDATTRAAACELIASWGPLAMAARPSLVEELAAVMKRFPQSEPWPYTAEYAWAGLGVRESQLAKLAELVKDPKLSPIRRAQAVRLVGRLGSAAQSLIPDLQQLLKLDPQKLHPREQGERAGIDGDLTAAREVLSRLKP
jgi:HEAT repeat protein